MMQKVNACKMLYFYGLVPFSKAFHMYIKKKCTFRAISLSVSGLILSESRNVVRLFGQWKDEENLAVKFTEVSQVSLYKLFYEQVFIV